MRGKNVAEGLFVASAIFLALGSGALADEGGVSFWLPGLYGSFAAVPGEPGWSLATIYYHSSVGAGANAEFLRGGVVTASLEGRGDLVFFDPTYTFADPLWGGQAEISVLGAAGRNQASVDATLTGPMATRSPATEVKL